MESTVNAAVPVPTSVAKKTGSQALQAIGLFKLVKALLFFAGAAGMFHLVHRDTEVEMNRLLRVFRINHDTSFVKAALLNANLLDDPHKRIVGGLLTMYGLMFITEGVGLMMRKRWAEWFTSILTFSAIPLELYEIHRHYTNLKLAVTVLNVLILAFLVLHLVRTTREHNAALAAAHSLPPVTPTPEKAAVG